MFEIERVQLFFGQRRKTAYILELNIHMNQKIFPLITVNYNWIDFSINVRQLGDK